MLTPLPLTSTLTLTPLLRSLHPRYTWTVTCPGTLARPAFTGVAPTITVGPGGNIDTAGRALPFTCNVTLSVAGADGTTDIDVTPVTVTGPPAGEDVIESLQVVLPLKPSSGSGAATCPDADALDEIAFAYADALYAQEGVLDVVINGVTCTVQVTTAPAAEAALSPPLARVRSARPCAHRVPAGPSPPLHLTLSSLAPFLPPPAAARRHRGRHS